MVAPPALRFVDEFVVQRRPSVPPAQPEPALALRLIEEAEAAAGPGAKSASAILEHRTRVARLGRR